MRAASLLALSLLGLAPSVARAQDSSMFESGAERRANRAASLAHDDGQNAPSEPESAPAAPPPVERPFLYLVDPTMPRQWQLVASYGAAYTSTESAARPLAANAHRGGLVNELRAEFAMHERVAPFVTGLAAPPVGGDAVTRTAFNGGVRLLLTDPSSRSFRLALDVGYGRDFERVSAAFGRATASYDVGALRLAAATHVERAFARDRDDVDFFAVGGASYAVAQGVRLGAEYVGQDLEGAWDRREAEGGVRHFAGANVAWSPDSQLLLTAGPAFGLGGNAPAVLGRAQVSYLF